MAQQQPGQPGQQMQLPRGAAGKELQRTLFPGEQVLGWAEGRQGNWLVATDQRAILMKFGSSAGGLFNGTRKVAVFPYATMTSVDLHTGFWYLKYVQLGSAGAQTRTRTDINSIVAGENTFAFTGGQEKQARAVTLLIQQRVQQAHTPQAQATTSVAPVAPPPAPVVSIPDQLQQLAQLHAHGALTDDEFAAMKAKILAS